MHIDIKEYETNVIKKCIECLVCYEVQGEIRRFLLSKFEK